MVMMIVDNFHSALSDNYDFSAPSYGDYDGGSYSLSPSDHDCDCCSFSHVIIKQISCQFVCAQSVCKVETEW